MEQKEQFIIPMLDIDMMEEQIDTISVSGYTGNELIPDFKAMDHWDIWGKETL